MDIVPSDVTTYIASQLDIKSFSIFMATCKYANENTKHTFDTKVFNNIENLFKNIISTITGYDALLSNVQNKYKATQNIYKSLFMTIRDSDNPTDMDYLLTLLDNPVEKIVELIETTEPDVYIAINNFAFLNVIDDLHLEEFEKQVLKVAQDCLFTKEYIVEFDLFEKTYQSVKYRLSIKINLSDNIPVLSVMMFDVEDEIDLSDNEFSDDITDYIDDAEITCDGEVAFTVTDTSIKGLSRYISKVFGNGIFTHKLKDDKVRIMICNFLNQPFECCEFYRNVVYDMPLTQQASSKIMKHLNSNIV